MKISEQEGRAETRGKYENSEENKRRGHHKRSRGVFEPLHRTRVPTQIHGEDEGDREQEKNRKEKVGRRKGKENNEEIYHTLKEKENAKNFKNMKNEEKDFKIEYKKETRDLRQRLEKDVEDLFGEVTATKDNDNVKDMGEIERIEEDRLKDLFGDGDSVENEDDQEETEGIQEKIRRWIMETETLKKTSSDHGDTLGDSKEEDGNDHGKNGLTQ
jgi:hypothetical protein